DRFPGPIPTLGDRSEIRSLFRSKVAEFRDLVPFGSSFNDRADFAITVQSILETRMLSYLGEISDPASVLILAGGVALNCSINATIAAWCRDRQLTLLVPA